MELVPLTPDRFDDLAALLGTTAVTRTCYCFYLRRTARHRALTRELLEAAVAYAKRQARPDAPGAVTCRW